MFGVRAECQEEPVVGSWETNEEPMEAALIETASGVVGIGAVAGLAVLLPMEAGVPVPLPADLVMLTVGARVGAGDIPLWVAVLAFEAIAAIGTAALFLLVRGPGHGLVVRVDDESGSATPAWSARAPFSSGAECSHLLSVEERLGFGP